MNGSKMKLHTKVFIWVLILGIVIAVLTMDWIPFAIVSFGFNVGLLLMKDEKLMADKIYNLKEANRILNNKLNECYNINHNLTIQKENEDGRQI